MPEFYKECSRRNSSPRFKLRSPQYENPVDRPCLRSRNVSGATLDVGDGGELKADLDLPGATITMSETGQKSLVEFLDGIERRILSDLCSGPECITCKIHREQLALIKALRVPLTPLQCPWPKDVWPTTLVDAGDVMREKLGDADTTAISGVLMRQGWELAIKAIVEAMEASVADSVPARTESAPASE